MVLVKKRFGCCSWNGLLFDISLYLFWPTITCVNLFARLFRPTTEERRLRAENDPCYQVNTGFICFRSQMTCLDTSESDSLFFPPPTTVPLRRRFFIPIPIGGFAPLPSLLRPRFPPMVSPSVLPPTLRLFRAPLHRFLRDSRVDSFVQKHV